MSYLAGLVGQGIASSRSPDLHEAEAAAQGLTLVYRLLETGSEPEALRRRLSDARAFGFDGLNITHPFKQTVLPLLDGLSEDARALGAVNTVVFGPTGAIGHNTDWYGFSESLRRQAPSARLARVTQIGAGGAGSATAYALLKMGVQTLTLYDAFPDRAAALADRMTSLFPTQVVRTTESAEDAAVGAQGVVQATPIGMTDYPGSPIDASQLSPDAWIVDIIYFPLETSFYKAARARGCLVLNGLGMVAFQGAKAFELFTGRMADGGRILDRLRAGPVALSNQ